MEEKIASLWEQLTSNNKLDRDRGNQQLELDLKINKDLGKDIWRMDRVLNGNKFRKNVHLVGRIPNELQCPRLDLNKS